MQRGSGNANRFQFGYGYDYGPSYEYDFQPQHQPIPQTHSQLPYNPLSSFSIPAPLPVPSPYGHGNFQRPTGLRQPAPPAQNRPQVMHPGILPLAPPPMPPIFSWDDVPIRPPLSITELNIEDPTLPFVPAPTEKIDLLAMAKSLQKQQEEAVLTTISNLTKEGIIKNNWPSELKQMFQPLFCKLCTLSLSSPVVAMDHYKGKRHGKSVEQWLIARGPRTKMTETHTQGPGPLSGSNTMPLGQQGVKRKLNEFHNTQDSGFSNKRFPLGKPPPTVKKAKKDGPTFAYCEICEIPLSSKSTADQHFAGKPHKKRLLEASKTGNFDNVERSFGIGNAFRVAENGSIQHSSS